MQSLICTPQPSVSCHYSLPLPPSLSSHQQHALVHHTPSLSKSSPLSSSSSSFTLCLPLALSLCTHHVANTRIFNICARARARTPVLTYVGLAYVSAVLCLSHVSFTSSCSCSRKDVWKTLSLQTAVVSSSEVRNLMPRTLLCPITSHASVMSSSRVGSRDDARVLTVTRIYSDQNGDSRFGSFTVTMTGSGTCV